MLQFKSIKKTLLTTVSVATITVGSLSASEPIGSITERKGEAYLTRDLQQEPIAVGAVIPDVLLNDTAETKDGRMLIKFLDNAQLDMTEFTKAYLDKVYYDPDPSKSKMTMRFVQGTARFTSGRLGMVPKQNIDLSTPTAQIAVRGTDFTTTIDELGRTLVILLPDEFGGPSGVIDVFNDGGSITLDQAYQATMVATFDTPPTPPVTIANLTVSMIDNMFIVNPPTEVKKAIQEQVADDLEQDQGLLDVDFLEFNELEGDAGLSVNELDEFSELDIDALAVDFLPDLLDVVEELIRTTAKLEDKQAGQIGTFNLDGATAGLNKDSQYNIFEQDGDIIFYRDVNGTIRLQLAMDSSVRLDTYTETYEGTILLNGGDDIIIVITQQN